MLLKTADDKTRRLQLLLDLQQSTRLDTRQKEWLSDELFRLRKGIEGERDAAHYVDNYLCDSENNAVLHDLRFVVDGETGQIDHLILGRTLNIYLLETKNFGGDLHINEHGEFSVEYTGRRRYGIPSPLEQSRRHEVVLAKLLDRLEITGRAGLKPTFHHIVLVSPKSLIERPDAKRFDTSRVIKADQFRAWHERFIEKEVGPLAILAAAVNMRSPSTVREWGEKLRRQHRPVDPLALPEFMAPRPDVVAAPPPPTVTPIQSPPITPAAVADPTPAPRKRLICATCGDKISYPEGKFCWNNERRFGGLQYCREHQAAFNLTRN